ncbi:DUF7662 domain-containing protein [Steroidobacter cummioxidans]|uniref:DUF7662 domain-containing protein n=1 Tax=Steroidobacter cummioxidans TaxID=1803913 RepID=UPI000E30EFC5|nr:hypothetical protein [Steroidobacter cummioxidans]
MAEAKDKDDLRYGPLGRHLRALPPAQNGVTLSFDEIETILSATLPPSAFRHRQWWANQSTGSRAPHFGDAAGFQNVENRVDAKQRLVRFVRKNATVRPPRALLLQDVVSEVNEGALTRRIGKVQEWRKGHRGFTKLPSATLFYSKVEQDREWAFHVGGLSELQFNVGFEPVDEVRTFRHGVAFSLQPTRELPDIDPLVPKIARFNEYFRIYPDSFDELSMWHWAPDGQRSANSAVAPIPDELVARGMFIFIGALQPADAIDIEWILDDFDRLLPLYEYVEGTEAFPKIARERKGFVWTPGNKARVARTTYERSAQTIDKALRHNLVQDALFKHLEEIHGKDDVSGEQEYGNGTRVDVSVKDGDSYVYYEIKTGLSAQSCIREALGQLMEYSYWPGAQQAERLIVVGEATYDKDAKAYIKRLRTEFCLPIEYQQFDMKLGRLI